MSTGTDPAIQNTRPQPGTPSRIAVGVNGLAESKDATETGSSFSRENPERAHVARAPTNDRP